MPTPQTIITTIRQRFGRLNRLGRLVTILLSAVLSLAILGVAAFFILDVLYPLPLPDRETDFAVTITAEDGSPLRGFPDQSGVWRYPVTVQDVSPLYLEALIQYEDRWFYRHPGINPFALVRALTDWVSNGRIVTGGSTLTMQTARILDSRHRIVGRTIGDKIRQIFRAIQLERRFTKAEILTLYLNYAPFGGPVEGVQAACYAYLGKSARELSHAEAALMAVLPQSPTRCRPDLHPQRATAARDKVIHRMVRFGVWDRDTGDQARIEKVMARFYPRPMSAPLLARRLKPRAGPDKPLRTFIDPFLQETAADLVQAQVAGLPPRTSAAVLIVENRNLAVRAYVGSADFADDQRFGYVDMVQAERSPGSTLKPFLYAMALEEGLIHSESLLVDAPLSFKGYRPGNFNDGFAGPVSASDALARSLNIPAVDLVDRLGPAFFDARLRQGGLYLTYPPGGGPNLAMILGGVGATLEDLVGAYTALAMNGLAGRPRLTVDQPLEARRLLDPGAAFIVRDILTNHGRPDLPGGRLNLARSRQVAWKTGTSYGYRDAWSIGVTDVYTVGVWVGRPDGTPSPGQYGRATAAPLLMALVDSLPRSDGPPPPVPANVIRTVICWPLGTAQSDYPALCQEKRQAWILNGVIPPTLPDRSDDLWRSNPLTVMINPRTHLRVDADCPVDNPVATLIAGWPKAAGPWLTAGQRQASRIPGLDPACGRPVTNVPETIKIIGIEDHTTLRPTPSDTAYPAIDLQALGGRGRLFWLLNDELIGTADIGQPLIHQFRRPGDFHLTVMDLSGNFDMVNIEVMGNER